MQRLRTFTAIATALGLLVGACGGGTAGPGGGTTATQAPATATAAPTHSAAMLALIDGAKKEGSVLDLTWANYVNPEMIEEWKKGFTALYGIPINLTITPEPAMNQGATKLITEFKANRPASTDVFLCTEVHVLNLNREGVASAMDTTLPGLAANAKIVDGDGNAVHLATSFRGITYNPDKIKGADIPKTLADVLRLSTRFTVASTPQASVFETIAAPEIWGEAKMKDYLTQLSKNLKGLIQGQELHRISNGEFDMFVIDYGKNEIDSRRAKGQNLAWVFPTDAPMVTPIYNVIPKHAKHPNMAKLWVNYLVSRPAQELLYKYEFTDNIYLAGSKGGEELKKLEAQGVKYYVTSTEFAKKNTDAYTRIRADFIKIVTKT